MLLEIIGKLFHNKGISQLRFLIFRKYSTFPQESVYLNGQKLYLSDLQN
jgi:hypothetical protein